MRKRILVRPAAERDIEEQAEYLALHSGVAMALRFYRVMEESFQLLANRPKIGKLIEARSRLLAGTRWFPLKSFPKHLVFYRPVEDGIEIIRLLHGARDIESLLES